MSWQVCDHGEQQTTSYDKADPPFCSRQAWFAA
jgi:hypothetical protein